MKIKKRTHYTIKTLIYLADSKSFISIKELSQKLDLSFEHCRKIIKDLNELNLLETKKGRNGGIKLLVEADDIEVYNILLFTENITESSYKHDCANCSQPIDCNFKRMLKDNSKVFYDSFRNIYISDLIKE